LIDRRVLVAGEELAGQLNGVEFDERVLTGRVDEQIKDWRLLLVGVFFCFGSGLGCFAQGYVPLLESGIFFFVLIGNLNIRT
jgi:hypothetical protein